VCVQTLTKVGKILIVCNLKQFSKLRLAEMFGEGRQKCLANGTLQVKPATQDALTKGYANFASQVAQNDLPGSTTT
jgi:hypothetical protein